jgi:hypothetical protein
VQITNLAGTLAVTTIGGLAFTVSYTGGTGSDVVLTRSAAAAPPRILTT